jgi:hypothetical protein
MDQGYMHERGTDRVLTDMGRVEEAKKRLEYLRGELRAERISYGELHELQSLRGHIAPDDAELLEAAGVPEGADDDDESNRMDPDFHADAVS